jgi:uncharacterized protein (UPF0147 family)
MGTIDEVQDLLQSLLQDPSLSKNVRVILEEISEELKDETRLPLKINSALQKVEDLSLDPNISQYVRTQIWSLSTLLESAQNGG